MSAARRVPPPCGCTIVIARPVIAGKRRWGGCQLPGSLWRVTLAQTNALTKGRFRLVCGFHRSYLARRGEIISSERVTE